MTSILYSTNSAVAEQRLDAGRVRCRHATQLPPNAAAVLIVFWSHARVSSLGIGGHLLEVIAALKLTNEVKPDSLRTETSWWKMTMEKPMNVCVLVGSLRKASFNGMLANALISLAPSLLKLDIVEVGQLPFYNEDIETAAPPAQWTAFRQRVKAADAVLFVTPEYNRSVPAVLKNALDVGSRPYGSSVWDRKPGAVSAAHPARSGPSAPIII